MVMVLFRVEARVQERLRDPVPRPMRTREQRQAQRRLAVIDERLDPLGTLEQYHFASFEERPCCPNHDRRDGNRLDDHGERSLVVLCLARHGKKSAKIHPLSFWCHDPSSSGTLRARGPINRLKGRVRDPP